MADKSRQEHTPLPWRVGDAGTTVFGPKYADGAAPAIVAGRLRTGNAALIVRAVNAHNALVRAAQAVCQSRGGSSPEATRLVHEAAVNELEKVLRSID